MGSRGQLSTSGETDTRNAIDFINYVVKKFPFRIRTIRSDRGHEFQALFHWHVADLGMEHVYIKPRTPQLNGKVERSHRTDKDEFYQLLTYRDDVDLEKKLAAWEKFYNYGRPHGAHKGKTPYEALREKLRRLTTTSDWMRHITRKFPKLRISQEGQETNPLTGSPAAIHLRFDSGAVAFNRPRGETAGCAGRDL